MISELFSVLIETGVSIYKAAKGANAEELKALEDQMVAAIQALRGVQKETADAHDMRIADLMLAIEEARKGNL